MLIEDEVERQLAAHFADVNKLVMSIGVSGGADSMCLLHILQHLGVELHVVHINYQKRGRSSDKDARLVKDTSVEMGIDCEVITVDPAEGEGMNFQQWARELRYRALELKADETGSDAVAVAHHQDDQIETILQKIFRGGGMASWAAMQVWNGQIFRPLLHISRHQIEKYCRQYSVPYRSDESNFKSEFARNFLRNDWLPEMEKHFPGWRTNILRVAEQARVFGASLDYILQTISDDKDRLNRKDFLQLNEELRKSVLLHYVNQVDSDQEISRDALGEITGIKSLQTGKGIQLSRDMELVRDREVFKLVLNTEDSAAYFAIKKEELSDQPISLNELKFRIKPFQEPDYGTRLYLDADALAWPIRVRPWQDGDRFQPLGMSGHQSVADHLTNRKISAVAKDKALVVESFEETICAVIFPPIENRLPPGSISEQVKCTASTRESLVINRTN